MSHEYVSLASSYPYDIKVAMTSTLWRPMKNEKIHVCFVTYQLKPVNVNSAANKAYKNSSSSTNDNTQLSPFSQ